MLKRGGVSKLQVVLVKTIVTRLLMLRSRRVSKSQVIWAKIIVTRILMYRAEESPSHGLCEQRSL